MQKGDYTMNYSRPRVAQLQAEVTRVGRATAVITGQTFKSVIPAENVTSMIIETAPAYEADE
jgi:hypothetical protein